MSFSDLFTVATLAEVKANVISIAQAAGLTATSFIFGDPSERWIEISARTIDLFTSTVTAQTVRGFFLDLATDPGDAGDLSADQTPRAGWLSALGSGWYGVTRSGQTYAAGFVTVTNAGTTPAVFKPYDITFQRSTTGNDGGKPTYRNSPDGSIYTGFGGTVSIAASATRTIPVIAEQPGSYSTANPSEITGLAVTQSFGTITAVNASPIIGIDRESISSYITRCRSAADKLSYGGPGAAYKYAATTGRSGAPLQRWDGTGQVGITRVYASPDSINGVVTVYFANSSGAPDAVDVSSANANITGIPTGVITDPLGVVGDAITIAPTTSDVTTGGPGGAAAIATSITIAGTCKVKAVPGGLSGSSLILAVRTAIVAAYTPAFAAFDIGGVDQVAGAGVIYTSDLQGIGRDSYPGLYDFIVTTPGASSTAIAVGHVATVSTAAGSWTVTVT